MYPTNPTTDDGAARSLPIFVSSDGRYELRASMYDGGGPIQSCLNCELPHVVVVRGTSYPFHIYGGYCLDCGIAAMAVEELYKWSIIINKGGKRWLSPTLS